MGEAINWRAKELPVTPATCTVNGYAYHPKDAAWAGLDLSRAIVREKSTAAVALLGPDRAWPDHHLDVPWCHPDDQPEGWSDCIRYRVRPRRRGWRFEKREDEWRLVREPAQDRKSDA